MIEQWFNNTSSTIKEMTDIFKIGVENLESKANKINSYTQSKKKIHTKSNKRKRVKSNLNAVESSKDSLISN